MLIISIISFILIHRTHGVSSIFGEVHDEYLHKIVRNTKSSEMVNYLDVTSDPCTNFYDYVCGNYKRINPSNDLMINNVFQDLTDGMHRKFLSLIKHNEMTDTLSEMKVKNFYESCMNLAILRNTYKSKVRDIINEFGLMPALEGDNWRESNYFDWLKTIAEINRKYGTTIILGSDVLVDVFNKKRNALYIKPQDMPLGSESAYTDEDQEEARNIRKMNIKYNLKYVFGLRKSEAEKIAEDIFQFETHLFVGYTGQIIDTMPTINISENGLRASTVEELQTKYDIHIDIKRLIKLTFGYLPNATIYDTIEPLAKNIINAIDLTRDRIVANYIFYNLIESFMLIRDPYTRDVENFMSLASPKRKQQLQKMCIVETEKHFSKILNYMVYRKYMPNVTALNLKPMWEMIKLSFRDVLATNSIPEMRGMYTTAMHKLQAMKLEIRAYEGPNFVDDYDELTISKHDYVENIKSILTNEAEISRSNLNKTYSADSVEDIFSILPDYDPLKNVIIVPISLLQPYYLWSNSYPNALKYGTVGVLIARQMIHAFGKKYMQLDKSGNFIQPDENFVNYISGVSQCFKVQYHNYYLDGRSLPKLESQVENMADSGGVRLAYNAYMRWNGRYAQQNSTMEQLSQLNYTSQQLFFISFGQMLCSAGKDFTKSVNGIAVETFRVNQALSNIDDFSQAFNCSSSSSMNPRTRCMIF